VADADIAFFLTRNPGHAMAMSWLPHRDQRGQSHRRRPADALVKPIATLANGAWLASEPAGVARFRRRIAAARGDSAAHPPAACSMPMPGARMAGRTASTNPQPTWNSASASRSSIYDDLEPWIERIMRGERGVLESRTSHAAVPTSGAYQRAKAHPIHREFQNEINAAIGPWMVDLCREHPSVPFGQPIGRFRLRSRRPAEEESAVPIGFDDDSAYLGGIKQRLAEANLRSVRAFANPGHRNALATSRCSASASARTAARLGVASLVPRAAP
jgi:hypothetical protein